MSLSPSFGLKTWIFSPTLNTTREMIGLGDQATHSTGPSTSTIWRHRPVATSQNRTVLSSEPVVGLHKYDKIKKFMFGDENNFQNTEVKIGLSIGTEIYLDNLIVVITIPPQCSLRFEQLTSLLWKSTVYVSVYSTAKSHTHAYCNVTNYMKKSK